MTVVAIGKNSFLGRAAAAHPDAKSWRFLSHKDALDIDSYKGATCVVNFALHSDIKKGILNPETDFDSAVASLLKDTNIHYVVISSRTVYGPSLHGGLLIETDPLSPITGYGKAKKNIEENVKKILGDGRVTVLRLASIFGFEVDENRQSFFSMALCKLLAEGRIEYQMSPEVKRDFLSVVRCADALVKICNAVQPGIYNVGSGIGLQTGDVAEWLFEGYEAGELVVANHDVSDVFWLDMTKTKATFNIATVTRDDLRNDCLALGVALRELANQRTIEPCAKLQ
jgi:dTDP-4-dehydrorhamnose reductase